MIDFSVQYAAQCCGHKKDMSLTILSCSSLDLQSGAIPEVLTALLKPKSGFEAPDWLLDASTLSKETKEVLKLAFAFTELTKRDLEDSVETKNDAKAKKGEVKQSLESEDEVDRIKGAVKTFTGEAVNKEIEITQHRFGLIAKHLMNASSELESFCECTRQACKVIHSEYDKQDCQLVAALVSVLKGAVKEGLVFSYPVQSQRGMLRVVSDSVTDIVNEESSTEDSLDSCREANLLLLIKGFRSLYTGSYANVDEAAKLCYECLIRPLELKKHLVASEDCDDIDKEDYMTFVRLLNKQGSGYINWRAMVCNMVVSWVPRLRQSTVSDFASAANALQNCVHLQMEPTGMVTMEEWKEMDFWFKHDSSFDVSKVLWEVFYQDTPLDGTAERKRVLDPKSALSSICLDVDGQIGVEKFRALHSTQLNTSENSESDIQDTYLPCLTKPDQTELQEQRRRSLAERLTLQHM